MIHRFSKKDDLYISRTKDCVLGALFGEAHQIRIIELQQDGTEIETSNDILLEELVFFLENRNKLFKTNYKLSKVCYSVWHNTFDGCPYFTTLKKVVNQKNISQT